MDPAPPPESRHVLSLLLWLAASRVVVQGAAMLGTYFPRPLDDFHWKGVSDGLQWRFIPIRALDVFGRWDTMFYVDLAANGYPREDPAAGWIFNAAYFPFYPTLMRGLSILLGDLDLFLTGVLISHAMLALSLVYLYRLARLDGPPELARMSILCVALYPGSHFLQCVYPDATALFLGVFAVYLARTGRPWMAGLSCGMSALTRASGVMVCLAVLFELAWRRPLSWRPLVLLIPVAALGAHMGLNAQLYGDPLYFAHVQAGWGRAASSPLAALLDPRFSLDYHLLAIGAVALIGHAAWTRARGGYVLMAAACVLLPLSSGTLDGIHRYLASAFPLYLFLASLLLESKPLRVGAAAVGMGLLALFSFKWGQGYLPR